MYIHQILNILLFLGIIELITWLVPSIRRRGSWNHAKGLSGDFNTCQDSVVLGHLTNRKYAIGVSAGDCFQCYLSTMERILLEMQRNGGTDWLLCALTSIDDEAGMYEQMEAEFSEALSSGHLAVMVTEGNIHSCFQAAQYYLHIPVTDTLQFADNFMDRINSFVGEISGNDIWYTINFSTIPNLGVLFKATYLHSMSDFNTSSPFSDVTGFINSMYPPCHPDAVDVTATCLQELGVVQLVHHPALMWLAQLVQTQEPWPWTDVPVIVNPPVVISSSLSSLPTRSLTKAYYYQVHLKKDSRMNFHSYQLSMHSVLFGNHVKPHIFT